MVWSWQLGDPFRIFALEKNRFEGGLEASLGLLWATLPTLVSFVLGA